jgi:Creatinine amidohydrolase
LASIPSSLKLIWRGSGKCFLPVQRIGVSVEHVAFPGTLTLSAATAIAAWTELGESLARAGIRKLVLVTSHGGNVAAMELVNGRRQGRLVSGKQEIAGCGSPGGTRSRAGLSPIEAQRRL